MTLWIIVASVVSFVAGFFLAMIIVSRDKDLIRLHDDELIVKKPENGLILAAVQPDVLRRLVMDKKDADSQSIEARDFYRRPVIDQKK
jgi:hypothetical protein